MREELDGAYFFIAEYHQHNGEWIPAREAKRREWGERIEMFWVGVAILATLVGAGVLAGLTHFVGGSHPEAGWAATGAVLIGGFALSRTMNDDDDRVSVQLFTCFFGGGLALGMLEHL